MEYIQIHETASKRFYRFNHPISRGKFGTIEPTRYVVISESPTKEKLVFAFYFTNGYDESAFKDGSKNFLKVNRVHLIGELQESTTNNMQATDDYYLKKLLSANKNNLEMYEKQGA